MHHAITDRVVEHRGAVGIARAGDRAWELELHAGRGRLDVAAGTTMLRELLEEVAIAGGGPVAWRVPNATAEHRRIAAAADLSGDRRLVQLRRSLPAPRSATVATRPFQPGRDDHDWVRVNNAAFAWHPEQSEWTVDRLRDQLDADWVDLDGFLVHPVDGPLDGFCWTKVHHDLDPPIGEIFVIGVDPAAAGRGLGTELVLAGLDHLTGRGLDTAMLYTESDNHAALAVYDRLGFALHHDITVFSRTVEPVDPPSGRDADH